jgi:Aldehyde dehydrogenase family
MSTPAMTDRTSSDRAHRAPSTLITGTALTVAEHWIDGEWTGSDTVSESINPATGEVLGRWADGGEAKARAAIAAARRAFDTSLWSRDQTLRHKALSELADRFRKSDSWTVQTEAGAKPRGLKMTMPSEWT